MLYLKVCPHLWQFCINCWIKHLLLKLGCPILFVCMESSPPPFYAARPSILPHTLSASVSAVRQMLQMHTEIPSQRIVGLLAWRRNQTFRDRGLIRCWRRSRWQRTTRRVCRTTSPGWSRPGSQGRLHRGGCQRWTPWWGRGSPTWSASPPRWHCPAAPWKASPSTTSQSPSTRPRHWSRYKTSLRFAKRHKQSLWIWKSLPKIPHAMFEIVIFLKWQAARKSEAVAVNCSGGSGRTGAVILISLVIPIFSIFSNKKYKEKWKNGVIFKSIFSIFLSQHCNYNLQLSTWQQKRAGGCYAFICLDHSQLLGSFSDAQIILRCLLPISSGVAGLNQSQQWLRFFFLQEFTVFNFHFSFYLQKCQNQATPPSFN